MVETMADTDPVERLLSIDEVAERLGVHRDTIYNMVHDNRFPQPIKVGSRPRWTVNQFNTYVADLLRQKEAEQRKRRRASRT
jgi:excisionase family DNA binding protein